MSVKASIVRDTEGFPVLAVVTQGAQKIEVVYEKDSGFTLSGSRRSLENQALINALRLIYPTQDKVDLTIPQPLQVFSGSSNVLLFDDFEATLLKWDVTDGGARDATVAYNGEASLNITCGAGVAGAVSDRGFPAPRFDKRMTVSFMFAFANRLVINYLSVDITCFRSLYDRPRFVARIYATGPPANSLYYMDENGAFVSKGTFYQLYSLAEDTNYTWHKFKMTIKGNQYENIQIDGIDYSMLGTVADQSGSPDTFISIRNDNTAGNESIIYIDDLLIVEEA